MKKTWKSSVLLIGTAMLGAIALSGTTVMAGPQNVPVTATVTTSVVEAVGVTLDFGSIDLNPAGDTITIDAAGVPNGGGAALVGTPSSLSGSVVTGTPAAGTITIAASVPLNISVSYPANGTGVSLTGPGTSTATLDNIDANSGAGTTNLVYNYNGVGGATVYIGGELTFPAGSLTGAYAGVIPVTVSYQ